ncbi:MAG TPA: hypothetical protein VFT66_14990 [Roseiflexaceae bacterium]|jgi:dTMP kinase|nr:hypothetical protein [Roseiflexaceae bacterium]
MIICFTGIDGSGKTVQAEKLVERLNAAGHPAVYAWTGGRSYITRPLIWLAKRLLRAPKLASSGTATEPKGAPDKGAQYRSYLSSTRRLFKNKLVANIWRQISLIEHTGEILVSVVPHVLRGRIVVCDRYIHDSTIGMAVLAGVDASALPRLLRLPALYPIPRPAQWFLIDVPADVAFHRRDDVVDVAFLEQRIPLYHAAAQTLGMDVIDGTPTPDHIADVIWERVKPLLRAVPKAALRKS